MRTLVLLALCSLPPSAASGAEAWTVKMQAVSGRVTYSRAQASPVGKQVGYVGKSQMRGPGRPSEIIFNTYLNAPEEGVFRLDYQAEVSGENRARPPFQAAGKVQLRPGKPVLAAEAGGWKLILELQGSSEEESAKIKAGTLETRLKCGRDSYPANFTYMPDQQYSAVLFSGPEDEPRKFMVGLLPNSPGVDGTFQLQYTLQLKEGGETLASSDGQLVLEPGGPKRTAAAGKGCVFSAAAR